MTTTTQPKIVIIGAGGVTFPLRLMGDMLSFPALRSASYSLMDIDLSRAERTTGMARELAEHYGFPAGSKRRTISARRSPMPITSLSPSRSEVLSPG